MTTFLSQFPSINHTAAGFISGPAGALETIITAAPQENAPAITMILCHPHPLFGGTMHNKVITTLAQTCKQLNIACVRFNFRGVEKSEGSYAQGLGETDDLFTVMDWVQAQQPTHTIWLAGFSFGSYIAARAASLRSVGYLVTVAPAVSSFDFTALGRIPCPWLIIQGEEDEVIPPAAVYDFALQRPEHPVLVRLPHTSHFFHGQLLPLRQVLLEHLSPILDDTKLI